MEVYFFNPERFQLLYNCNLYTVEEVPLERRQQILAGTISIGLFIIFEILYIPCLFALWQHLEQSCHRIMFTLGVVDIFGLAFPGLLTGILGIQGAVYCTNPQLIYWTGCIGNFFYGFETCAAVLLAANRCLEMASSTLADQLFMGARTWFWLGLVFLYALCYCFFDNAIVFSGITYTWTFNPHAAYLQELDDQYVSSVDLFHECFVFSMLLIFYALFLFFLIKGQSSLAGNLGQASNYTKKIVFLQVFLLSALNTANTACYILLPFTNVTPVVFSICGTFGWELIHGLPPVIYLAVNRTLRKDCLQMVKRLVKFCGQTQNPSQHTAMVSTAVNIVIPSPREVASRVDNFRPKTFTL